MLCYVMLCYVMLCYVMLCYVMLCYVMEETLPTAPPIEQPCQQRTKIHSQDLLSVYVAKSISYVIYILISV